MKNVDRSNLKVIQIAMPSLFFALLAVVTWIIWRQQRIIDELRQRLAGTDVQLMVLSRQTDDHFNSLANRLDDLSKGVKTEISASRRQARGDLARLSGGLSRQLQEATHDGNGLSGRLDEVARVGSGLLDRMGAVEREGNQLVDRMDELAKQVNDLAQAGPAPAATVATPAFPSGALPSAPQTDMITLRRLRAGKQQFEAGRYDESRKTFQEILAVRPDYPEARLYFSVSFFRSNPSDATRYPQVEKDLRSVLSQDGGNMMALETLALVQVQRERWADASELFQKLLILEPDNPAVVNEAGFCAVKLNDVATARDYFARAMKIQPHDREALSMLGDCQSSLGNAAEAEQAWKAALTLVDPRSSSGAREGVALSVKLTRSAAGRSAWEESLADAQFGQQMGQSPLLRTYEGLSLMKLGKSSEGRSILTQMAKSDDAEASDLASRGLQESSP